MAEILPSSDFTSGKGLSVYAHPMAQTALVCDGGSSQCRWFLRPMMSFLQKLLGRESDGSGALSAPSPSAGAVL
jgi:hypothetical protein